MRSFLESAGPVLDCGCGGGNFCIWLSKRRGSINIIGLDLSEAALKKGQEEVRRSKINNVYLIRGDAENLPVKSEVFETAGCHWLLEHLLKPQNCLRELVRVTRSSGKITIFSPNHASPISYVYGVRLPIIPWKIYFRHLKRAIKLLILWTADLIESKLGKESSVGKNLYHPTSFPERGNLTDVFSYEVIKACEMLGVSVVFRTFDVSLGPRKRTLKTCLFTLILSVFDVLPIVKYFGPDALVIGKKMQLIPKNYHR